MSIKLTFNQPELAESLSLDLYHAARSYQNRLGKRLADTLATRHNEIIAPAQLGFLAALICGDNTASDIARRLGVSRQAAQKQAAEMVDRGYLEIMTDPRRRNQRLISFTERGTGLMAACRAILAEMDAELPGKRADGVALLKILQGLD